MNGFSGDERISGLKSFSFGFSDEPAAVAERYELGTDAYARFARSVADRRLVSDGSKRAPGDIGEVARDAWRGRATSSYQPGFEPGGPWVSAEAWDASRDRLTAACSAARDGCWTTPSEISGDLAFPYYRDALELPRTVCDTPRSILSDDTPLLFGFDAGDPIGRVTACEDRPEGLFVHAVLYPTVVSSWRLAVRRRRRAAERSRRNARKRRPHGRTTTPARRER